MTSTGSARPARQYGPHDAAKQEARRFLATFGALGHSPNRSKYGDYREERVAIPRPALHLIEQINMIAHLRGGLVVEADPGPPFTPDTLGLSSRSGRCSHGFDVATQHPTLCPCGATEGHE